jgi:hypothetical protein
LEFLTWPLLASRQLSHRKYIATESWQGKCNITSRDRYYGGELMEAQSQDWRVLSEAASREQDPEKLIQLVEELNRALLRREVQYNRRPPAN